jgi:hypothetical protein
MPNAGIEDHEISLRNVVNLTFDMILSLSRENERELQMIMAMIDGLILMARTLPDIQEGRINLLD